MRKREEGSVQMEKICEGPKVGKDRIFKEYTEFPNDLSIEQIKEVIKADTGRRIRVYNSYD